MIRILIVLLIGIAGWVRSFFLHLNCNPYASYAIKAPAIVCYLFGSFRKDHIVNFVGVLTQIIIYFTIPLIVLSLFGKITSLQFKIGFGVTLMFILLLEILYSMGALSHHR